MRIRDYGDSMSNHYETWHSSLLQCHANPKEKVLLVRFKHSLLPSRANKTDGLKNLIFKYANKGIPREEPPVRFATHTQDDG